MDFLIDFAAGGIAATISKTATAPIERVKLIIQNQASMKNITPGKEYKGIVDCFTRVSREEGVQALWRGNLANIIRYFPTQALNFAFKERFKILTRSILGNPNPKTQKGLNFLSNILSGGLAGTASLTFVYPLDFARTRLGTDMGKSASERQFTGMFDCVSKIAKSDGIGGLFNRLLILFSKGLQIKPMRRSAFEQAAAPLQPSQRVALFRGSLLRLMSGLMAQW